MTKTDLETTLTYIFSKLDDKFCKLDDKFKESLDTHTKFVTEKLKHQSLSGEIRVHLVKHKTISSSKSLNLHVKQITYMNNENGFDLLIYVIFSISPHLPKYQDPVFSFYLCDRETSPQLHIIALKTRG